MALDPLVLSRAQSWLKTPFDSNAIAEIDQLFNAGDEKELYERFYTELEFGTGGLRGIMGAGLNRMNRYTVGRATQGLANYIIRNVAKPNERSVVIAYDSRINSDSFARETAQVLAGNGIKVYLFSSLRPTPELSFAVRHLKATSGIVITASHNPKEYNGYKVYWSDGGQVVPPHDKGIIAEVKAQKDFNSIQRADFDKAAEEGLIINIGSEVDEAYYKAILALSIQPDVCKAMSNKLRIMYTPLHGAGISLTPQALERWGFRNVFLCKAQATPDGTFPSAASPNPEEPAALAEAIKDAKSQDCSLVLATDPDADRVGIAVRKGEEFRLMSGNQVAAMLVDYVLDSHEGRGDLPRKAAVVKTIVTTELIAAIGRHYGVRVENVLTGFKYIGEKIHQWEQSGEAQYMVGGEESYGYLVGTHARDKDAVVCACFIAEMAADSLSRGETLLDRLDRLFQKYGVFEESQISMKFPGAAGQQKIAQIMTTFRDNPPAMIAGSAIVEMVDYQRDEVRDLTTGQVTGKTGLPISNVLVFRMADGDRIVARPSGTEPKIKFYFMVCDCSRLPIASDAELKSRKAGLDKKHQTMREEFAERVNAIARE